VGTVYTDAVIKEDSTEDADFALVGRVDINPVSGTATAGDVRSGVTFSSGSGIGLTGTMPNQGSPTLQPGQSIAAGYYAGGSVAVPASGSQTFTASGTFTVPSGVTRILAAMWGGGGAPYSVTGYPGGGGGFLAEFFDATPGQQITVTVGSGGASNGANGGNTSLSISTDYAAGGTAGTSSASGSGGSFVISASSVGWGNNGATPTTSVNAAGGGAAGPGGPGNGSSGGPASGAIPAGGVGAGVTSGSAAGVGGGGSTNGAYTAGGNGQVIIFW